jgi:hypothetical protein
MVLPLVGLAAGVAARAVAKKVASNAVKKAAVGKMASKAIKAPKGGPKNISTGKMKATIKANKYKSEGAGAVNLGTKSGNMREYMSGAKVKGTARNVRDNAHRAELEAKGYSKRASVTKYPTKKLVGNPNKLTTSKVPVKKSKGK